ncbi:hypothetical protein ADILRU_1145 [Leifsonia rubra CMS 76R]|nr:hypothetical protein ADILRU_1145 [Leifsonia rubra CMS 76R]
MANETVDATDRLVRNARNGRFDRTPSALTAGGAVVASVEVFFGLDKASFNNRWMWVPVVIGPTG